MIIYDEFYNLIVEYIYGNPDSLDSFRQLVATELATIGSVCLVALPLIVVFWLVKFMFSLGNRW